MGRDETGVIHSQPLADDGVAIELHGVHRQLGIPIFGEFGRLSVSNRKRVAGQPKYRTMLSVPSRVLILDEAVTLSTSLPIYYKQVLRGKSVIIWSH
jgi:hypothetical protein